MSFKIYNASGAKIADGLNDDDIFNYYKNGLIKEDDKIVEESKLSPEIQEHYRKLGEHYNQTAIARDIANVKKKRG